VGQSGIAISHKFDRVSLYSINRTSHRSQHRREHLRLSMVPFSITLSDVSDSG